MNDSRLNCVRKQVHRDLESALLSVVLKVLRNRPFHFGDSGAGALLRKFHFHVYRSRRLEGTVTTIFEALSAVNAFALAHLVTSCRRGNTSILFGAALSR